MQSRLSFRQAISLISLILCTSSAALAEPAGTLTVTSSAFKEGDTIPKKFTGDGADISPPFAWAAGPVGTKSYALSCEDPDAPGGTWWHWILFNVAPETNQLGESISKSGEVKGVGLQGLNDFHKDGYNGPAPPAGKLHHYHFKIMALDTMLSLGPHAAKVAFIKAVKGHVLAEGQITGVYKR